MYLSTYTCMHIHIQIFQHENMLIYPYARKEFALAVIEAENNDCLAHIPIHTHTQIFTYVCLCIYIYVFMYICKHTNIHTRMHSQKNCAGGRWGRGSSRILVISRYTHTHIYTNVYIYIHIYICMLICILIFLHTCVYRSYPDKHTHIYIQM